MADTRSPGWYPAPDGNGQQWWNGAGWSDSRRGAAGVAAPPLAPVAGPTPVAAPSPPPVYSASNPPPLRPDPYARPTLPSSLGTTTRSIDASVNRNAMVGFITGIVAVFFNVLFLMAPIAIVFSILGLSRARQLRAQGVTNTLALFAWIGLALGVFAAIGGLVQIVIFVVSIASVDIDAGSMIPASGLLPWLFQR